MYTKQCELGQFDGEKGGGRGGEGRERRPETREKQNSAKLHWPDTKSRQYQRERTGARSWGYPEARLAVRLSSFGVKRL